MKELTIEQKAKAYDEALERAKVFKEHLLEINDKGYVDEMDYIFPELQESEDEEIRKFLIQMAQNGHGGDRDWWNKCVAWLEKQGEHTDIPAEWSEEDERNFDIIYGIIYNSCNAEDASRLIAWLKAIKDRVVALWVMIKK